MFRSEKLKNFDKYAFASISALKKEVSKRMKVVDMGVGDPDIPTPKEIQGALVAALGDLNVNQYPDYQGDYFFREAVARFFLNRYKVKLDPEKNILGLIGSKEGIFHLPLAILNPGDVGTYTVPGYPVYRAGIAFAGGKPVEIPLRQENKFLIAPDEIPENTKLLFVNYPNNPTTAVASEEFFKKIVSLAHERNFLIANDAAYSEIYLEKISPPISILNISGAMDVSVEFHSLSKTFCMTGWRIGFVVGNEEAIASLSALKKYIDSGLFRAIQQAGKNALDNYWEISPSIRKLFARRVEKWCAALEKIGISAYNSGATFYVWAEVPKKFNDEEFAKFLLERTGIVALPGSAMGDVSKKFVRFSMTLPDCQLEYAIQQLEKLF